MGQLDKDLQQSKVYKENLVQSRELTYTNTASISGEILIFDEQGRLKEEVLKDNFIKNKCQSKRKYLYNDAGYLIKKIDSIYNQIEVYVIICNYVYNDTVLISCDCKDQNNKMKSKKTFENNGYKVTEMLYRGDTLYRTQTCEYDSSGYKIRFYGKAKGSNEVRNFTVNGKTFTVKDLDKDWDYKFVNVYHDKLLTHQTRFENGIQMETEEFQYNKKGLLINKINSGRGKSGSQEKYTYKFR